MAPNITASLTSFISPSTIMMLSMVAATIISRSASAILLKGGLMQYSPLILATLTSEIGPLKGMSLTAIAAEAAKPAIASGWMSFSAEIRFTVTKTSAWKSSGKSGLRARSIKRATKISESEALPSRFMNPPGNLPAAANFSL